MIYIRSNARAFVLVLPTSKIHPVSAHFWSSASQMRFFLARESMSCRRRFPRPSHSLHDTAAHGTNSNRNQHPSIEPNMDKQEKILSKLYRPNNNLTIHDIHITVERYSTVSPVEDQICLLIAKQHVYQITWLAIGMLETVEKKEASMEAERGNQQKRNPRSQNRKT